jgi:hypothetical protein
MYGRDLNLSPKERHSNEGFVISFCSAEGITQCMIVTARYGNSQVGGQTTLYSC